MSAQPWPRWVRYPLVVVLAAAAVIALVVAAYDRGLLPLAGPFVAVVVASTLVYLVAYRRNRRLRGRSDEAVVQLQDLLTALQRERDLAPEARPTGADDASLRSAKQETEQALQRFAWGHELGAVPHVEQLSHLAQGWRADAPLSRHVAVLAGTAAQVDEIARRMLEADRRRRAD